MAPNIPPVATNLEVVGGLQRRYREEVGALEAGYRAQMEALAEVRRQGAGRVCGVPVLGLWGLGGLETCVGKGCCQLSRAAGGLLCRAVR